MSVESPNRPLLIATHGAVRVLTLNRPAALNSFTVAMHEELRDALEDAAADTAVRALVDHRRRPRLLRRAGPERPRARRDPSG